VTGEYQREKAKERMRRLRAKQIEQTTQQSGITPPPPTPKPVEGRVRRDQKWGFEHGPGNPCDPPECIICHPEAYEEYKRRRGLLPR